MWVIFRVCFLLKGDCHLIFAIVQYIGQCENIDVQSKDLRGNPKPRVSPDRTGPDRNRSGVGEHFKEYFRVGSGRGILFRVGPGRGILFRVGPGRGIFLPGYETFSPGISGINLPFIPKLRKENGYYP